MKVSETDLPGVLIVEPVIFKDARGSFSETWREGSYAEAGIGPHFVQDNVTVSKRRTVRGLHFQNPQGQGKLVWTLVGEAYDVAVDVRRGSPTFGRWVAYNLSEENRRQLWIPPGFAHGFQVLSESALFVYKCTEYYQPQYDRSVLWSDASLGITWPLPDPILSPKDASAPLLSTFSADQLPTYR